MTETLSPSHFADTTQQLLAGIIAWPKMSQKLLEKPPVRFIRDVFVEVSRATGCGKGLFSREEIDNMSSSRENKFAFLTMLLHFVAFAVDEVATLTTTVRVAKMAAGLEPENTNLLLQRLHRAATDERCRGRWPGAIETARQVRETGWSAAMYSAYSTDDSMCSCASGMVPSPRKHAPGVPKRPHGDAPKSWRSTRRYRDRFVSMPAVSDSKMTSEMVGALPFLTQKEIQARWEELGSRVSGFGNGGRQFEPISPRSEDAGDCLCWRSLLLANGFGSHDDAKLARLIIEANRLNRAARRLRDVVLDVGLPDKLSEVDFGHLVVGAVWPGLELGRRQSTSRRPSKEQFAKSPAAVVELAERGNGPPEPVPTLAHDDALAAVRGHPGGRLLYHTKAGVMFAHMNCHPSQLYSIEDKLGQGSFGYVQRGIHLETGRARAIKTTPKTTVEGNSLWSEIEIMRQLDHPHIMKIYGTFEDQTNIYMIFELCSGGQLFDAIIQAGAFPERTSSWMMKQILAAVCYLHQRSIAHRDLKPENFMLDSKGPVEDSHIKLIDFGTAKRFDLGDLVTKVCTVHYVAPELLKSKPVPYDEKCDVWACGIILYVMLSGTPPFDGDDDMEVLKKVKKGKFAFRPKRIWDGISDHARNLVSGMVCVQVQARRSAEQAVRDQWFEDLATPTKQIDFSKDQTVLQRMRCYNAHNKLKKLALQVIAQNLPEDSLKKLRHVFLSMDHEMKGEVSVDQTLHEKVCEAATDSGEINYTQFLAANMDKQVYLREEACRAAFALFDVDGDGLITREDLAAVFAREDPSEEVEGGGTSPNHTRRGSIIIRTRGATAGLDESSNCTRRSIGQSAAELLGVELAEIERVMDESDVNGDGVINFEEFMRMIAQGTSGVFSLPQSRKESRRPSIASDAGGSFHALRVEPVQNIKRNRTKRLSNLFTMEDFPDVCSCGTNQGLATDNADDKTRCSLIVPQKVRPDAVSTYGACELTSPRPSRLIRSPTVIFETSAGVSHEAMDVSLSACAFSRRFEHHCSRVEASGAMPSSTAADAVAPESPAATSTILAAATAPLVMVEEAAPADVPTCMDRNSDEAPCPNPLWPVLSEKPFELRRLEAVLRDGNPADFANAPLCVEEGVPPALFLAVVIRSPEMVQLLLEHRADVRARLEDPWRAVRAGMTPLDVNMEQLGRYQGTNVFDRCEVIDSLLKAEEERLRGWRTGKRASDAAERYFKSGALKTLTLDSVMDSLAEEHEAQALREASSEQILNSGLSAARRKKCLYHSRPAVVSQHFYAHPSEAYDIGDVIIEGCFGTVSIARDRLTGSIRALKSVTKASSESNRIWQEIELMRQLDHPFVARLFCSFEDSESIYMLLEHCPGGELLEAVERFGAFSEATARHVFSQMLRAVNYLHRSSICHRDLKPEVFLLVGKQVTEETSVKLTHFGTARRFGPTLPMTTKICTIHYVAPEILSRAPEAYSEKCDMWSLGICLFVLLCGETPFTASSDMQVLKRIRKGKFNFAPDEIWRSVGEAPRQLISQLLNVDAGDRLSAAQALEHRWFATACHRLPDGMLRSVVPKLLAFRRLPWLKRKLLQVIAYRLPDAVDEDVLITWFELDRDRCGRVSRQNLNEALPDGGEDPAFTVALRELLRDMVSEEPEGYVGFTVFVAAMLDKDRHMTLASLRSAFVLLDLDGNGQINFQELQFAVDMQVCSHATVDNSFFECGRAPSSLKSDEMMSRCLEESQRVLDRYDSDNDKAMSFAEFRVFMLDNDLVSSL